MRVLRGIVASAMTVLSAATAHTLAGGTAPSPLLLAAAATLAAPIAVALVGRRPALLRTSAAVLAAQVVFHGVFALFGGPPTVAFTSGVGAHAHTAAHMVMTGSPTMTHDSMSLAHLLAAVATVLVLHRGERMLRAVGSGIRRLIPLRVARTPRPLAVRVVRARFIAPMPHIVVPVSDIGRRGPPLSV